MNIASKLKIKIDAKHTKIIKYLLNNYTLGIKLKLLKKILCQLALIPKQPSRGVLRKRCSENKQQIYRKTPMPK